MTGLLENDLASLATAAAPAPSPFEPVAAQPRYPPPPASVHPDPARGWIRRLLPLLAARRGALAVALGGALAALLAQVAVPRVIMGALDAALARGTANLAPFVWALAGLAAARGLLTWLHRDALLRFAYALEADLRVLLYAHLGRLSFSFYDRAQSGELISRANADIRAVQMFLAFGPLMALTLVGFAVAVALMLAVHVPLTLVALAPLPLVGALGVKMRRLLYPISWVVQARQADVATIVAENVTGVRVVRSFAAEQQQLDALAAAGRRLRWASVRQLDVRGRYASAMENLPRLGLAAVLGYGGWLALGGQVTVGALVAFSSYVVMLQAPFRMLGAVMMLGQRAAASADRILELLDQPPEVRDRPDAADLVTPRGEVGFRAVGFGYQPGHRVLDGFSLQLRPGETVALVGRSGSGKSTVARLLARFYDVDAGQVLVDGRDVRDLTLASLRASVGMVLDEPFLFSASVRDNIAYGRPDAALGEVVAAARASGAAGFIAGLDGGYDCQVGERGYTLSGGQRQRIAIARTLLLNPQILVLDDATSAVDAETEQQIHAALRTLMRGRTTLVIAHRLSTISLSDRVALLEGGRVVAEGAHGELMATEPRYAAVLADADG
ncbi:MAG TPA: ABC transporter ATP-binding protein, partial [Egibacteraceae bacterium]|nr:ABC transporter ATP-binding protein [Egibacteraceae bacterium]